MPLPRPFARVTACHGNSTSAAGSAKVELCLCDPGFELVAGACVQCAAGKFKGASGNEACELCATDDEFAGAAGATECETCYPNSHSEATRELLKLLLQTNTTTFPRLLPLLALY